MYFIQKTLQVNSIGICSYDEQQAAESTKLKSR